MNYSKLKDIITKHNYSIAKIAHTIGRTEAWFHKAIKNDTMTIADLEKILKLCGTSMSEFFGGQPEVTTVSEPSELEKKLFDTSMELNKVYKENRELNEKLKLFEGKTITKTTKTKLYK